MPRRPHGIVAPCADCGANNNKPEDTHPVVHSANIVYIQARTKVVQLVHTTQLVTTKVKVLHVKVNGPRNTRLDQSAAASARLQLNAKTRISVSTYAKEFVAQRALSRLHQDA